MALEWIRRCIPSNEQKVATFCRGRRPQPDDEFLAACAVAGNSEASRVALAVRRAIAKVGCVDPQYIRADDSYPGQLESLPVWDSMDWMCLIMQLEDELDTRIPDHEAERLFTKQKTTMRERLLDPAPIGGTVKEMVDHVRQMLARREKS